MDIAYRLQLGSQMPEYKVQEVKKSKLVIVHYGIFKIGWDWLILLCTFYIAIMVPFNAAFRKQGRYKDFIYIDVAVELLFAIGGRPHGRCGHRHPGKTNYFSHR